eukprot:8236914-Pyramimonas_sp.AAC.1
MKLWLPTPDILRSTDLWGPTGVSCRRLMLRTKGTNTSLITKKINAAVVARGLLNAHNLRVQRAQETMPKKTVGPKKLSLDVPVARNAEGQARGPSGPNESSQELHVTLEANPPPPRKPTRRESAYLLIQCAETLACSLGVHMLA